MDFYPGMEFETSVVDWNQANKGDYIIFHDVIFRMTGFRQGVPVWAVRNKRPAQGRETRFPDGSAVRIDLIK